MLGFSGLSSQGAKQYFKAGLGSVKGNDEHGQGNPQKGAELSVVFHSEGCCLPLPPHMAGAGEEPLVGLGPALVPSVPTGLPGCGISLGSPFLCLQTGTMTLLRDSNHLSLKCVQPNTAQAVVLGTMDDSFVK